MLNGREKKKLDVEYKKLQLKNDKDWVSIFTKTGFDSVKKKNSVFWS